MLISAPYSFFFEKSTHFIAHFFFIDRKSGLHKKKEKHETHCKSMNIASEYLVLDKILMGIIYIYGGLILFLLFDNDLQIVFIYFSVHNDTVLIS